MARKNNSRKLPNRPRNLPLVGDPSPLAPPMYNEPSTVRGLLSEYANGIEHILEELTDTQILSTALAVGVKATEALGVKKCYEHFGYKELGGNAVPSLNYATDVVWCHSCFTYYRLPKKSIRKK